MRHGAAAHADSFGGTSMNTNRYLLAAVAGFTWLMAYGFVVNGVLLADFWDSQGNPALYRPEGEEIFGAVVLSFVSQALALGYVFTRGYEGRGLTEGLRFGALVAWFVASLYLLFYAIQPWSIASTVTAMAADGLMYVGLGAVLALVYRRQAGGQSPHPKP